MEVETSRLVLREITLADTRGQWVDNYHYAIVGDDKRVN